MKIKTIMALGLLIAVPAYTKIKDAPDNFQIKLNQDQAKDEINFWAQQMSEHNLFLALGLEDPALKKRAAQLHAQWEAFRKNPSNMNQVIVLLKDTHALNKDVIKAMANGKNWIGWIYEGMVEHMDLELTYFRNKLAGIIYTIEDELEFWNTEHMQGALTTAHLLDPTQKEDTLKGLQIADKFEGNQKKKLKTTEQMWIELTQKYTKELDDYYTAGKNKAKIGQQKSIIHPVLRDHEAREVKRSEQILNRLQKESRSK